MRYNTGIFFAFKVFDAMFVILYHFGYICLDFFYHLRNKSKKRAKIRNRCNQALHLTLDTNGKVTGSQLDFTNESQEV